MRTTVTESVKSIEVPIYELFSFASHTQIKQILWNWLKSTVCGNFNSELEEHEKVLILALYEHLETLVDRSHAYYELNKKRIHETHSL